MNLIDIARGAYVRSPKSVRRLAGPLLTLVPQSLKLGRAYKRWRTDIARSEHDLAFVEERRLRDLRRLIGTAYRQSTFYRAKLQATFGDAFDPETITHADLERLPLLTKPDIRAAAETMLTVPASQLDRASTSGSSGQPLLFFLDKDRSVREFAFITHAWSRSGYRNGEARAVLRGLLFDNVDEKPYEWEAGLRELRLSPFAMSTKRMDQYIELIDSYKTAYIHGYPSAIEILCRHIWRTGHRPKQAIRGIFPISEPIYPYQRDIFRAALPEATVVPFYGLSERALFATEQAGLPDTYEFQPHYGHAELLDAAGRPVVQAGSVGRIFGTGFVSTGMPFIRYETGDTAELVEPAGPANLYRLRVRSITPRRKPEFLIGADGQRIVTPTIVPVHPSKFYGVSEFQFYQDTVGECLIKVVPAAGCSAEDVQLFVDELQGRLGSGIRFTSTLVGELAGDARGKRPFIDQRLDLSRFDTPIR